MEKGEREEQLNSFRSKRKRKNENDRHHLMNPLSIYLSLSLSLPLSKFKNLSEIIINQFGACHISDIREI